MRVLVACEYSGRVRDAFAAAGCDSWSCDLLESEKNRVHWMKPGPDRWKERSRTYTGIARAMADQWAPMLKESGK